jgi:branched chain amino acid efflux pump
MSDAALATIAGMAADTYATRASGLWLGNRLRITPRLDSLSAALPGAILVALVAPAVFKAGVRGIVASAAAALVALRMRGNIVAPMVVGVATSWALRLI